MSVTIPVFWQLLGESRLLAREQCERLAADFGDVKGASEQGTAKTLAEWLVARNVLSKYQTTILLAGRAGPFHYGEYKVYDRVDRGRLAGQFRAVHAPTGHPVLLQFLTGSVLTDSRLWGAIANEVLAKRGVASPYVQQLFEPVDLQTFKFLAGEDLRGETLDQRLAVGRFQPAEACRLARLAAIGLAQLHQAGRVHGDVRPANLLVEPVTGQPANLKLLFETHEPSAPLDFAEQPPSGRLLAQADYLAPELLTPGRVADPLSDVYALGATLYALLAGTAPFAGGTIEQKMARHASEPIRPLEQFGVPQPLAQVVAYLMAKNPAIRFQSAALVAEQLAPFIDPAALQAQPPPPPPTLVNYESFLRQKSLGSPASSFAPVVVGVKPVAEQDAGLGFRSDREHLGRLAASSGTIPTGVAVPGGVAIQLSAPGKASGGYSAEEILRRGQEQQKKNLILGLVGAGVLSIAAIVGLNMLGGSQTKAPKKNVAQVPQDDVPQPIARIDPPANSTNTKATATAAVTPTDPDPATKPAVTDVGFQQEVVADDSTLLWASPTTGKPVSLRCVPPEGQVFVIVRPADLIASGEGEKVLAALGPAFAAQRTAWEQAAGFKLAQIEQLVVTLHNNDAQFPRASFVVKTSESLPAEQLLARWGNPAAAQEGTATYYTGPAWSYYISAAVEAERTFLMAEARDVKEVAKVAGMPPVLFREMERMRRALDGDRHVSVLFKPQFFFNDDGEPLFAAERAKVRQPLSWLLGEGLQAGAVSLHLAGESYFEMRMLGSLDKESRQLASELRDRLSQVPAALEDYLVLLTPPPYWKKLSFRYPAMIHQLHANLRVGVESEQAVVNSVLPASAAHNLVLGGELLIASAPGAAVAAQAPVPAGPKTIEEALEIKTTYSFDQQSLEFAMRDLAADVQGNLQGAPFEFAIKIIGPDLEKDGITRNQSVRDFKQENQTVGDILTALVRKANPVTTVKDPAEKDQKLIWVIAPDPDDAAQRIVVITTRAAAETKKYSLPSVFLPKAS